MTQAAALRKRVTHAVLASVAIFALSITYWGLNTFQQSEASITTDRTTITFEEFAAPRLLGTQNEYVDKGVKFSNDAGQTDKTTALTKEGAQCTNGVFTAEQLATSGTNRLHPYPNVSDPLVITFTENRVTTDVSLQLLGVGDAKNLVEFFDHTGALIEKKEYVNPGTGAGCDKKQLVSLTKPNIAKIRISQPGNNFAVTQDGLGIDDLSFAILGEPIVFTVTPTTGTIPLTVKATYTISTGSSVGSTTIPPSSVVSWGDGQTTTLSNTTVEHTYTTAGIYSVVLTVSGQKVGEQTITASDTVQQDPSVVFSASKDSYSTGEIVQLTLRNGGPGTVELPNGAPFDIKRTDGASVFAPIATQAIKPLPAGQSTSWTWNQRDDADKQVADGSYVATVRYATNDAQKTKQATFTINKGVVVPPFDGSFSITPTSGTLPLAVTFTCESKNSTALTGLTLDWGDGTVISDATCPSTLTHSYTNQGEYTVKILQGGQLIGAQKVLANAAVSNDGKGAPRVLASTGANLLIVLIIAAVLSGLVSYFILRRPFHGNQVQ